MREPNRAKSSQEPSVGRALSWTSGVAGTIAAVLIGAGFNVIGYSPPSFGLAKICFAASALLLMVAVGISVLRFEVPPPVRAAMACLVFAAGVALMLAALLWVAWRESDFALHQQPLTAVNTATPGATGATTAATNAATQAETVASPETFKPGSGSRDDPFTNADVWRITEPYDSETIVEANAITTRYIGMWLRVDAKVFNVLPSFFASHDFTVGASVEKSNDRNKELTILIPLDETKVPAVKFLRRNQRIVVLGKISEMRRAEINLEKCELISP